MTRSAPGLPASWNGRALTERLDSFALAVGSPRVWVTEGRCDAVRMGPSSWGDRGDASGFDRQVPKGNTR